MTVVESYTPVDIRTCGAIINRIRQTGGTIEEFLDLASVMRSQAANPRIRKYRLEFLVNDREVENNKDVLDSLGLDNLRCFYKLIRLFERRGIDINEIKKAIGKLRKIELASTTFGRRRN